MKPPRKQKARDLSRQTPTAKQASQLQSAFDDSPPIVRVILGHSLIEYEIELLLRYRLRIRGKAAWDRTIGENGPLDTFARKILLGYAVNLYDETMRKNLDIVRNIRNSFAHSKILLDFKHPAIIRELTLIALPKRINSHSFKRLNYVKNHPKMKPEYRFRLLCYAIIIDLMTIYDKERMRRDVKSFRLSPIRFTREMLASLHFMNIESVSQKDRRGQRERTYSAGPTAQAAQPTGLWPPLGEVFRNPKRRSPL